MGRLMAGGDLSSVQKDNNYVCEGQFVNGSGTDLREAHDVRMCLFVNDGRRTLTCPSLFMNAVMSALAFWSR